MAKDDPNAAKLFRSSDEVTQWARREINDAARAFSLRIRELNDIATRCSTNAIDPKQAEELHDLYYERWGDGLPTGKENASDAEIYAALNSQAPHHAARLARRKGSSRSFP